MLFFLVSALDKLGYRGLFGSGLGAGLGPVFGSSLSANLSASLSASFGASLGNNFSANDRSAPRDGLISSSNLSLDRGERVPPSGVGRGLNGGGGGVGAAPDAAAVGGRKEAGVELVKPSLVYDIASLILYRCQALPIRLKIALDRLFSVLTHEDVLQVLHGFGWTYEDYSRGYMLQDHNGATLHKWNMVTAEEEAILLQQFLRFDESSSTSSAALNLSTTTTTTSPAGTPIGAATTPTGGGPPTPPKRSWNPINMGTSLINPVTGKKRVQCNVCLKTFCDKGALKIHFSAVHLREMHKCTVEGCNMMFSSRRSRNRHSANPNPKLHTPHVRRKISPHDGRTSGSHPVMLPHAFQQQLPQGLQPPTGFPPLGSFPGNFGGINPLTGLPFIPHSASATADLHKQALELQRQNMEMHALGKNSMDLSMRNNDERHWKYGSNASNTSLFMDDGGYPETSKHYNSYENKKHGDEPGTYTIDDDDSMSIDAQSFKGDGAASSPSANKRKRKSQNPTKFAFRLEDDDLISTDDDDDDDNDDELDDIDAKDSEDDKNEDKELDAMSDDDDDETNNAIKNDLQLGKHSQPNKPDKDLEAAKIKLSSSNYGDQSEMSNALRHLEDLSKGNFNHLLGALPPNGPSLHGSSPIMQSGNGISSSSPKPSDRDSDRDSEGDSHNEELENTLHYSEGGFLSNVDIPLDKENPRRCVQCGKMFQNHFGVKIHYQNVHLKLMHKCTVEGCNAAFPSKRSRDRHASNLNLHRKLLSTSTENSLSGGFPNMGFPSLGNFNSALNPEVLARLYSDPASSLSLEALKAQLPTSIADSLFSLDRNSFSNSTSLPTSTATTSPFFLHNLLPHLTSNNNLKPSEKSRTPSPQSTTSTAPITTSSLSLSSSGNTVLPVPLEPPEMRRNSISPTQSPKDADLLISPAERSSPVTSAQQEEQQQPPAQLLQSESGDLIEDEKWTYKLEDDLPSPDREGNMPCRFCYQTFEDGEGLKNHYDSTHKKDLFKCRVESCCKVFSSRRKRNNHELNFHSLSETRYET
ncbi:UNVERIFIED_CONTAM: hypothetical protein GTU68_038664 [Idotea baltica]|nr:hypothetical protein [Idotea baltica]